MRNLFTCIRVCMCLCVFPCMCYGVLYLGGTFPIGPSADFSILPGLTSWACTQTHTQTHTLCYLTTEVCIGLEQSLIGKSQWGIKRQESPSADWPTSLLGYGCWLIDCVTHVLPRFRPVFHHLPKWTQWRHTESSTLLLNDCSRSKEPCVQSAAVWLDLTNPTFWPKSHL